MHDLVITAGEWVFGARFEHRKAPNTCAAFARMMPYDSHLVHARWSGEGVWIPLGEADFGVGYENHTSHPAPGWFVFHPGGISETEILLAYGGVAFSSKMGQLAGNHFITIVSGGEHLEALGRHVLWKGATPIGFRYA